MSKNDKNSPATEIPSAVNGEGKTKKKGGCLKLGLGVFVALFLLAAIANRDEESGSSTTSSSSSGSASSSQQVNIPADQALFVGIVQQAQRDSRTAENDMARGGILSTRSNALKRLPAEISDWVGKVHTVDSNSDGKGVLSIEIAEGIFIQTWNNAFSDTGNNTLLEPGSDLFNKAATLKRGQKVRFSGSFFRDEETGINEQSMSLGGKLSRPEFTFKFQSVSEL